jgi:hypothetical protein
MKLFLTTAFAALASIAALATSASAAELFCQQPVGGRGAVTVTIGEASGRLLAEVRDEASDRLIQRVGVSERSAPGRELDLLYVGSNLTLSLASDTYEGRLQFRQNGRVRRVAVVCE